MECELELPVPIIASDSLNVVGYALYDPHHNQRIPRVLCRACIEKAEEDAIGCCPGLLVSDPADPYLCEKCNRELK